MAAHFEGTQSARSDRRYISAAMDAPLLERGYEADLARRWREEGDVAAMHEIITAHVRLVVKVASRFRGYGLPMADLIQEGNIGLLEAARRFDPEREVRFSTYATWWILAGVQEYLVRNTSIVRIGTTPAQKALFFNLRRLRARMKTRNLGPMTEEERKFIAEALHVPLNAVERMEAVLSGPDRSLNATIGEDGADEIQDFLPDDGPNPEDLTIEQRDSATRAAWLRSALDVLTPREQQIIVRRFLDEKRSTLAEIGESFGVTKERIRQIEGKALTKLRHALSEQLEDGRSFLN